MLSNPERHFLPSHWDWTKKTSHDPPIIPKTLHPNTFSNTEPPQKTKQTIHNFNMQFSTFGIFRNLPLRTSSKLNFMGDHNSTAEADPSTRKPTRRAWKQPGNSNGFHGDMLASLKLLPGHTDKGVRSHLNEPMQYWHVRLWKMELLGQSCSLLGGEVAFLFFAGEVAVLVLGRVTFQLVCFNKIHEGAQGTTSKHFS